MSRWFLEGRCFDPTYDRRTPTPRGLTPLDERLLEEMHCER